MNLSGPILARFRQAVEGCDPTTLRQGLNEYPKLRQILDAPIFSFEKPAVVEAASRGDRPTLEVLLEFGADINRLSSWEPGGFGVLHSTCFDHPELAQWLIEQGARVDAHAAAGLGRLDRLKELVDRDPEAVHQRGPDGQLPLHFAGDRRTVDFLLDRGADLDARCIDHDSTAAQWMIQRAPELSRYLLDRGAEADLFLAVALDDSDRVERLVQEDPQCLRARLGRSGYDPVPPGNILCWSLGWWASGGRASPHRVAKAKGNNALYERLLELSPPDVRLMVLAWHHDRKRALAELEVRPDLAAQLPAEDRRFLADAAWDGNAPAVEILLEAGFDPHIRGAHDSTPLDRAAFHGFADVIELLLRHDPHPPLDAQNEFQSTPLETLSYGSRHGWRTDGDFGRAAHLLAKAGSRVMPHYPEQGTDDVRRALQPFVDEPAGRSRRHLQGQSPVDGAELAGLEIRFAPNPTDLHEHPRHAAENRPSPWIWYYRTEIHNLSDRGLTLSWMDAFYFENESWMPGNGQGKALGPQQILDLFTQGDAGKNGVLPAGGIIVRPVAWLTGQGPVRSPVKWAVVAVDEDGREFWAEAEIQTVPYGLKI